MTEIESPVYLNTTQTCPHNSVIRCSDCRLAGLCLPEGLSPSQMEMINQLIDTRPVLDKGEYLYRLQQPFSAIYAVRSGCVKTVTLSPSGEENITGFYLPGDIIGLDGISGKKYNNSALAIETSSLCQISFDRIESLGNQLPDMMRHVVNIISREIVTDQHHMAVLSRNKAEEKLAAFLVSLSSRYQRQNLSSQEWIFPMSRGDIANYLGLTNESVSRAFKRLQDQNIIHINKRQITINHYDQLVAATSI